MYDSSFNLPNVLMNQDHPGPDGCQCDAGQNVPEVIRGAGYCEDFLVCQCNIQSLLFNIHCAIKRRELEWYFNL